MVHGRNDSEQIAEIEINSFHMKRTRIRNSSTKLNKNRARKKLNDEEKNCLAKADIRKWSTCGLELILNAHTKPPRSNIHFFPSVKWEKSPVMHIVTNQNIVVFFATCTLFLCAGWCRLKTSNKIQHNFVLRSIFSCSIHCHILSE